MTRPRIWMKMNRCRTNRELSFLSPSLLVWFDQKKKKKKVRLLTTSSAGGVIIIGGQGKIEINDTFEERLRLLEIDALPAVRETLFGKNENRRFYD